MNGSVADQPVRPRTPPGVGTPLRADRRPGQRHPSSHDGPDWKETKRRKRTKEQTVSRARRAPTMKRWSLDARSPRRVLPLALKSRPGTEMGRESEGARCVIRG